MLITHSKINYKHLLLRVPSFFKRKIKRKEKNQRHDQKVTVSGIKKNLETFKVWQIFKIQKRFIKKIDIPFIGECNDPLQRLNSHVQEYSLLVEYVNCF